MFKINSPFPVCAIFLLVLLISCQSNTSKLKDERKFKTKVEGDIAFSDLYFDMQKDSIQFIIGKDSIELSRKFINDVVKKFPDFTKPKAPNPDTLYYNSKNDYSFGEAQADGVYLVYACIQDSISSKNHLYDTIVNDLIKLHRYTINLGVSKRNLGTYFTHHRSRLFAYSVFSALRDQNMKNYNTFTLREERNGYFDSIKVEALKLFDKRIPYEYHDSKAEEERLRKILLSELEEVRFFINTDYKFKKFKAIYF